MVEKQDDVQTFIEHLEAPWQVELATKLRAIVHEVIPNVEEKIQYKKPHFLKNGQYAAVISPRKGAVAFMIMNTQDLTVPEYFGGPKERRWLTIKEGDSVNFDELKSLLAAAAKDL